MSMFNPLLFRKAAPNEVWILHGSRFGEHRLLDVYSSAEKAREAFRKALRDEWGFYTGIDDNYRCFSDCVTDMQYRHGKDYLRVARAIPE